MFKFGFKLNISCLPVMRNDKIFSLKHKVYMFPVRILQYQPMPRIYFLGVIILEGCTVELAEDETEVFAFKVPT
jgi:hypothetical protein